MKRLLLDVNAVLDGLLNRRPHADAASRVWSAVEIGRAEGLLSAHAVTTVHYLNSREMRPAVGRETTTIVTRNTSDFRRSPVRVLTPEQAAVWLGLD